MNGWREMSSRCLPGMPPAALLPGLVLLGLACMYAQLVASGPSSEAWPTDLTVTTVLVIVSGAASLIAAVEGSERLHRVVALGLLSVFALALLTRVGGARPYLWLLTRPSLQQDSPWMVWTLLVATAFALGGLLAWRPWGRWLATGLGAAVLVAASFDVVEGWSNPHDQTWGAVLRAAGAVLLLGNLVIVRGDENEFASSGAWWRRRHPLASWLPLAIVAALIAAPMVLVQAWVRPGPMASLDGYGVVLASMLVMGAVAALRGRTLGIVLLALASLGLLLRLLALLVAATTAFDAQVVLYHAIFWLPAIVGGLVAGASLVLMGFSEPTERCDTSR